MAPEMINGRPRVLIVSRRCVRKNKFIDFVGEYHLELLVRYGAAPVIVPRIAGVDEMLDGFEPIHGVLLCEGEDVDPSHYQSGPPALSAEEAEEVRRLHTGETAIDCNRDSIELRLAKLCLSRRIPLLGICRGSQVLNVAAGGTLHQDVARELGRAGSPVVVHMDYGNYDGHRHGVSVVAETPLHWWFMESLAEEGGRMELMVNSYHHQGVKRLAERFAAMGFAGDGLVEAFYDPAAYDPGEGEFLVGLQFHPERMRASSSDEFDYPGCPSIYQDFVRAAAAYQRRISWNKGWKTDKKINDQMIGPRLFQYEKERSSEEEERLKQMGVTVRNGSAYVEKVKKERGERGAAAAAAARMMERMSAEQLSELMQFYDVMGRACSAILEAKVVATTL